MVVWLRLFWVFENNYDRSNWLDRKASSWILLVLGCKLYLLIVSKNCVASYCDSTNVK